jgi:trk system potassium uptake protein TrkH
MEIIVMVNDGGGIKLTTFLIIFFGVFKFLQEQEDIVVFKKSIWLMI